MTTATGTRSATGSPPTDPETKDILVAQDVTLAYDSRVVAEGLDLRIRRGSFTVVVGPNACGKSTLLKAFSRVLTPTRGRVLLDGVDLHAMPRRQAARRIGLLAQSALAPEGITVADLVGRGRFPHQSLLRSWTDEDETAVVHALTAVDMLDVAHRPVAQLSGGQRQRVWVAMALAQGGDVLLLDEPTTFLDIAHQLAVLNLFARLHRETGRTLIAVLHDLNQAARFADDLVVMKDGRIVSHGPPGEVLTPDLVAAVFGVEALIVRDPVHGSPMMVAR